MERPLPDRVRSATMMFEEAENFVDVLPLLDADVLEHLHEEVESELVKRGWCARCQEWHREG